MKFHKSYSFFLKSTALLFSGVVLLSLSSCKTSKVQIWLTKGDESVKLQQQTPISFVNNSNNFQNIEIDDTQKFQYVDGFGYTLTGGSVEVINRLSAAKRKALLNEIFGKEENSISISYLRLSIGASDLDGEVFSYNDLPQEQTDLTLSKFSLARDKNLIAMLKEILTINPKIKIIAAPWSPPVWMKDNGKSIGGSLKPQFYDVYARYFVKYIQEMQKEGITIDAITPQNEPLHPGNNPSLLMVSNQQRDFIKQSLGPIFKANNIKTKIVVYDHNCNKPEYAINILNDAEANQYIDGSAFHLYEGDISALKTVHDAHPNKNLYFTEQWTGAKGTFNEDLNWHTKNVIIGSMRNWSKIALEWNLANDQEYKPHTAGGCTECKGAITVSDKENFTRNVAYYIIAHASKFVPANSQRISSTQTDQLSTVAFKTPEGKTVLIVQNYRKNDENFNIKYKNKAASVTISGSSVATYVF
ncbi:glycoside hydrolase family 30 beta sandwich domain-containing protein [Chryseobacterium wangxinyae]|uniref:glycoside hydrolase family 30 protein n=1 Tax=Chryseobacterium sp. CY350 TaxID=2997336 RepID=UPI00226E3F4F|nr:glycoside hydrolase family 30 beta sandwich domain-containing protein [Chryseobacterium sp. CY350]MCY0978286.1 glucosylceramidase [Chryseobacterium sp. CY350]WBZ96064.1 glycoside hydrolase family 30 beta sandwich domain-containing protein [Chryseobacterium sp. CY350]